MLFLAYALWLGPANWPVTEIHAYGMLYELLAECAILWTLIALDIIRMLRRHVR